MRFNKIAVLMGGTGTEREVSLDSGKAVCEALRKLGIAYEAIDALPGFEKRLIHESFDCAFIALHGKQGEDGSVQGLLDHLGLPYTSTGVLGSALSYHKIRSKRLWQSVGLPTPPFYECSKNDDPKTIAMKLGLPVAIKPISEGSSNGVFKIETLDNIEELCEKSRKYGPIMIEKWVEGREFAVGILGIEVLPPVEIIPADVFYNYDAKYLSDKTQYLCPAELERKQQLYIKQLAKDAYVALGACTWGRIDLIMDAEGDCWLLDSNTVPGLTSHSLVPKACQAIGVSFEQLVEKLLIFAMKKQDNQLVEGDKYQIS